MSGKLNNTQMHKVYNRNGTLSTTRILRQNLSKRRSLVKLLGKRSYFYKMASAKETECRLNIIDVKYSYLYEARIMEGIGIIHHCSDIVCTSMNFTRHKSCHQKREALGHVREEMIRCRRIPI